MRVYLEKHWDAAAHWEYVYLKKVWFFSPESASRGDATLLMFFVLLRCTLIYVYGN